MTNNKKKKTGPEKAHTLCSKGVKVTKLYEPVSKKKVIPSSLSEFASTSSPAQSFGHSDMLLEFNGQQQEERTLTSMNMTNISETASISSETHDMLLDPPEQDDQQERPQNLAKPDN